MQKTNRIHTAHLNRLRRQMDEMKWLSESINSEPMNDVYPVYSTPCGKLVMVRIGYANDKYIAHYRMPGAWSIPTENPFNQDGFEWRENPHDAQADLDRYASANNWTRMKVM